MIDDTLDDEDRIVAALRRIVRAIDLHSRTLADEHGLTGPQVATLRVVASRGPLPAGAIARAVHLGRPTMTGLLTRLEARGLLVRQRSTTDRRSVLVQITADGRAALQRAPSLLQDRFRQRLTRLADWERAMLLATLGRVASMMDAGELPAAPHLDGQHDLAGDADPALPPILQPEPA